MCTKVFVYQYRGSYCSCSFVLLTQSLDSTETLEQEKPLKILYFPPESCWQLRVIGLARSSQKQKQFGIGWDKNHRISQENRSQRTGQRTSVKNGFLLISPFLGSVQRKVQQSTEGPQEISF